MIKGYYAKRDIDEVEVKPNPEVAGFLLTEDSVSALSVGDTFTGSNGQWYIKVGEGDYRPWRFET